MYKLQTFNNGQVLTHTDLNTMSEGIVSKQDVLVDSVNIKTINGQSILGTGNITIDSSGEVSDDTIEVINIVSLNYYNEQSGVITNKETGELETSTSGSFKDFYVEDDWVLYASGYAPKNTGTSAPVTFFDADMKILGYETFGLSSVAYTDKKIENLPSGTKTVRVQTSSTITIALSREIKTTVSNKGFSISPNIEIGDITDKGYIGSTYVGKTYYRTSKFLKPISNIIYLTCYGNYEYSIFKYDNAFNFIENTEWANSEDSSLNQIILDSNKLTRYIKILFRKSTNLEEFGLPRVIVGSVEENEYFNILPKGNFQRLVIPVNVVNPRAGDSEEWTIQDEPNILPDYGVLMLPNTYSNIGKPTRLIIYCHGAGVGYSSSVSGFPVSDCQPEYWLGEGCAVMDIEGNPFNNSNRHGYMPQGIQCYENAYDWVIMNYNIRTDGVFLGGRSMGGGMCFEILQSAIPVVAACPVVPVANQLWWWNYMPGNYRQFCADHMGFDWPTSTGGYKMTDEEYQCLQDNFDKMVKYAPLWRGIENLPSKEELFAVGHLNAKTDRENEKEAELYSKLRFKVKAPVKIFASYEDTTVPYARNAVYMYNMIKNAAQPCELRLMHTDASSGHHFEIQDSRAYADLTTIYGETINAPIIYYEMMQFWRRYEKTI